MFVVLVIVPLLLLYFFLKTKRERKENHQKWLQLGDVPEELFLKGTIQHITIRKEKFFHEKEIYKYDLVLKSTQQRIKVQKIEPIISNKPPASFRSGDAVLCKGQWDDQIFRANTIQHI